MKKLFLFAFFAAFTVSLEAAKVPGVEYPELLPEAQIMPRPASRAQWVWYNTPGRNGDSANDFWRTWITLDEAVKSAKINVILEGGVLYVNGQMVPKLPDNRPFRSVPVYSYDLAKFLKPGRNLIAAGRAEGVYFNNCRPLMMHGEIELVSGKKIPFDSLPDMFKIGRKMKNWYALDFDDSKLPYAKSMGDVLSPPEYLTSFVVECMTTAEEYKKYQEAFAKSQILPASLADEPTAKAKIVYNGSIPGIQVANGKIIPPVLLIIHTTGTDTYDDQILRAYNAGVRLFQLSVKFDDLPYDPETGKYDYYCIDRYARRLLNLAPEAYIMLSVGFRDQWQKRVLEKYPDEAVGYATNPAKYSNDDINASYRLSFASDVRRQKVAEALEDLGKYVHAQPWSKRICFVRTNSGVYTEWHWFGMYGDMPDTGKAMTKAFRAYLKRLYKTDSALQKAWHDPSVTLDTVQTPTKEERLSTKNYLKNVDSKDRKLIDYHYAMGYERDKTLVSMVNAAKKSFPNALIGAYYGYLVTAIYPPYPYDVDMVLQECDIDFFSRPYSYDAKTRLAGGSGLHAHVDSHAKRFGKLTFIEADIRTHLVFASKNWRCRSPEETRAVFARDLGNMLTHGTGIQFYAVHDHFGYPAFPYSAPECIETIATAIKIWHEAFNRKDTVSQKSPVALVYDLRRRINGFAAVKYNDVASTAWERDIYVPLSYAGRPFDIIDLQSFIESKHHYNMVIFPEAFTLTAAERAALRKKLDRPDTAALWLYAPGINSPDSGFSDQNMFDTTGIKLKLYPQNRRYFLDMTVGSMRFWNRNYNPGKAWDEGIRVYADDPDAAVSGMWQDDQRPSFVLKKLPNGGLSIFCGTSITGIDRWRKIFDALGIPEIADNETYVSVNNRFLNIPLAENQSTTVRLPGKRFVRDLWSNQILAMSGNTITLPGGKPRTYLLEVDKPLDYSVKLNAFDVIVEKLAGVEHFDHTKVINFASRNKWQSHIALERDGIFGNQATGRSIISTRFAVDPQKKYRLSGEFRVSGVPGNKLENFYFGFIPYAANNTVIAPEMIRPMDIGIYFLAENAKAGDTHLTIKSADWQINTAHMCIAFNAKKNLSDLPNFDLSPKIKKNSARKNSDGTLRVTLSEPLKSAYPAGTSVRLHSADAMHIYAAGKNAMLTDQWQELSGVISGEAVRGAVSDQWWHGTKSAGVIFRYAGKAIPDGVIEFRNIKVELLQ